MTDDEVALLAEPVASHDFTKKGQWYNVRNHSDELADLTALARSVLRT